MVVRPKQFSETYQSQCPTVDTPKDPSALSVLEETLRAGVERGQTRWPNLAVSEEDFMRYLATKQPSAALSAERIEDLYLVYACLTKCDGAYEAFNCAFIQTLSPKVGKRRLEPDELEVVQQEVCRQLFSPADTTGATEPYLAKYRGEGPLVGWVKIIARRRAIDLDRRGGARILRERDDCLVENILDNRDPELSAIKRLYKANFKQALQEALGRLSASQRMLLRWRLVEQLPVEKIASLEGIHVATVHRRTAETREAWLTATLDLLRERYGLNPDEAKSVGRLLLSQLDLSLSRIL